MDAIPKGFGVRMVGKTLPTKHRTTRRLKLCAEAQNSQACNWARCHGHGALRNRQEKFLPDWARCHHFGTNWDLSKKQFFQTTPVCFQKKFWNPSRASRKHSGTFWNILEHRSGFPWSGPQIQELRSTVLLTLHLAPPLMMRRATCMSMSPNRALP
mmetsp:Transcript_23411/g.39514  ORF Transcript_23411/g.39514 Transcript_23411/m.39514 type:complete len:156 (+) Transcript_23411:4473-4940(+)